MSTDDQLNRKAALAVCHYAGFRGQRLVLAVAVMGAESGRRYRATYVNENGSVDRGLFQINDVHSGYISPERAYLPIPNAQYAFKLSSEGKDFSPWAAYNSGAYAENVAAIAAELDEEKAGGWKASISDREAVFDRVGETWVPVTRE